MVGSFVSSISEEIGIKLRRFAMSWIDLASLTLTLWCAVKGYLFGGYRMFLHCCGLLIALVVAVFLQRPFSAYLNYEWQVEAVFVQLFARNSEYILEAGMSPVGGYPLPSLAGVVMQRLVPEAQVLPTTGGNIALTVIATMFVKILALFLFFLIIAAVITLLLRIKSFGGHNQHIPEGQRVVGVLFGAMYGMALSMVVCVALDALTLFMITGFWLDDLGVSYLAQVVAYLLQYV